MYCNIQSMKEIKVRNKQELKALPLHLKKIRHCCHMMETAKKYEPDLPQHCCINRIMAY
ncbi:14721_t:CDS:2 [Dentiscutata heterogama]|uniref:14721_t:CDS:1 n=1 Tax=Dentiscutata heterogama TaxID=1316150 RepID=A0ACA9KHC2_9GLOM|nr:14721_t:CDS:2 [Dentiscutata heterogama]